MKNLTFEEKKFYFIFIFICCFGAMSFVLSSAIVFHTVPHENQQSANMLLAFCMSTFTGLSGYLIGASPKEKKENVITGDNNKIENPKPNENI